MIDSYGFQGIDFDLEGGGNTFNVATVVSVSRQLEAKYGPRFVISLVPRPYEFRAGGSQLHRDIAVQLREPSSGIRPTRRGPTGSSPAPWVPPS